MEFLCKPIKSKGSKYCLSKYGMIIFTSKGCCSTPEVSTVPWDMFTKCDMQWGCFSGSLFLRLKNGATIQIQGGGSAVKAAAREFHKAMNRSDGKTEVIDPEIVKNIKGNTQILSHGVIFEKNSCCSGISSFVPWECIISASMSTGRRSSTISMKTTVAIPIYAQDKVTVHEKKGAKGADTEKVKVAAQQTVGQGWAEMKLYGKVRMEEVWEIVMRCMSGETSTGAMEAPGTLTEMKYTQLKKTGAIFSPPAGCCGPDIKYFIPWISIASMDYITGFCAKDRLTITDVIGFEVLVPQVSQEQYSAFRHAWAVQVADTKLATGVKVFHRGPIKMGPDGVAITKGGMCKKTVDFHPWALVDAAEINYTCCGGSLDLVTDEGKRIVVFKTAFKKAKLFEVWKIVRKLKYNVDEDKPGKDDKYFAGKETNPFCCKLAESYIKIVSNTGRCSKTLRIFDLDVVTKVSSLRKEGCCCSHTDYLIVWIQHGIAAGLTKDNTASDKKDDKGKPLPEELKNLKDAFSTRLLRDDDVEMLVKEVRARMAKRAHQADKTMVTGRRLTQGVVHNASAG